MMGKKRGKGEFCRRIAAEGDTKIGISRDKTKEMPTSAVPQVRASEPSVVDIDFPDDIVLRSGTMERLVLVESLDLLLRIRKDNVHHARHVGIERTHHDASGIHPLLRTYWQMRNNWVF